VQLRGLAAAGRIRLTDTVWREGAIDKSVDAGKVKNLFPPPPAPAPGEGGDASEACEPTPPPPVETAPVPPTAPVFLTAGDPGKPVQAVPKEKAPRPPPEAVRKRRAVALKGATILTQDGVTVQYRNKCCQCGFEDRCRSSMPIGNGMTRIHFYCPQCRKGRDVQIQGIMV